MGAVELDCRWHFAQQLGGREDGPNDPMAENFKKTPYASLIRESIQNSLDAVDDDSIPVRMEYKISRMSSRNYSNFFNLVSHIQGCIRFYPQSRDIYCPMLSYLQDARRATDLYYIKVSDYNTTGMGYNPNDRESPFYGFVRAAGVSNKSSANAGGSFGFGKAAYFYISPIRTILVSTLTEEGNHYFEGVASLCTHYDSENNKCVSVGYYDNNNGYPVEELDKIPQRFTRDEIGTDIWIMGVDIASELDKEAIYQEMTTAVLQNFWLAVYHGKLDVKIGDKEINQYNILELVEEQFPDMHDNSRKIEKFNPRPYLEAVAKVNSDKNHVLYEEDLPTLGHVQFYGFKIKDGNSRVALLRSPRMFVQFRPVPSATGFYGVFFCDNPEGDAILRKIENPAHNEWMPSNWKDEKGKNNKKGRQGFKEMKEFLVRCMEKLTERNNREVLNIKGLDQYLYIPTTVEDEEDEYENESLISNPTGEFRDEGSSITTDGKNPNTSDVVTKGAIGKVIVGIRDNADDSKDGDYLSGKRKTRGKGGKGKGHSKINRRNTPSENGTEGSYAYELPVRYRTFAQKIDGKYVHNIIIHSDYDVPDGRIDLLIGSDQSEEILNIISSSRGVVEGNSISKLHIKNGKNPAIQIRFADDMPHAIKLDAYEIK